MTKSVVPPSRGLSVSVKTAKSRSSASTRWLARQLNDPYVAAAREQGGARARLSSCWSWTTSSI